MICFFRTIVTKYNATQRATFSANGQVAVAWKKVGNEVVTLYSLHTNHLGSVMAVGNAGGGIVTGSYAAYEPFGAFLVPPTGTNPSVTDRGFTGHRHNNLAPAWLGLVYMNARYYHPQLGRFISPDSIVPEPGNPQSYNRYSYSYNNPLNLIDPSGHRPTSGCDGYFEGCLSDADNWGANFVDYLQDHIDFDDPTSNPQGQIFLELYNYILPLGQADGASINEIVSQAIVDTVSFMEHGRDGWYPIASDADLLVRMLVFASVVDTGFDKASDGDDYLGSLPTRTRTSDKTHGLLILDDEPPIPIVSGQNGPAANIPKGTPGFDAITQTHVEGHVAALMVNHGWTRATLYINNVPCPSCDKLLPRMLPSGARLNVVGPYGFQKWYVGGRR